MSKPSRAHIDAEFVFDRYIGAGDELDRLGQLLVTYAPEWCSQLRLFKTPSDQRPIKPAVRGALKAAVVAGAAERGPTFKMLETLHGGLHDVGAGSAELRGASGALFVVIAVDRLPFLYLGERGYLGNHVAFQVRSDRVDSRDAVAWTRSIFAQACAELAPTWAIARSVAEYWAKVMTDGPTIQAIGRDFARFLPGLFWQNFFGSRYVDLIGKDVLLAAPGRNVGEVAGGVLIGLGEDPADWTDPAYVATERAVLTAIGEQYFFDKSAPDRPTRAPRWLPDGPVEILGGSTPRNDG